MKKTIMIISIICLSLCLSDLSFAKKKKYRKQSRGLVSSTVRGTEGVVGATAKGAVNVVKSSGNAVSDVLHAL
jgi:hypothetical protein